MSPQPLSAPPARSRRAAFCMLALSALACFLLALIVVVCTHTNVGPRGSFQFGAPFFAKICSVLIVPALLAWALFRFSRARLWTFVALGLMFCVLAGAAIMAEYSVTSFRPLVGHQAYDLAVTQAAAEITASSAVNTDRTERIRSLRPRLRRASGDRDLLAAVIRDCDLAIASLEQEIDRLQRLPDSIRHAFREHGVSDRRAEEYLRQVMPSLNSPRLIDADNQLIELIRAIRAEASASSPPAEPSGAP